MASSHKDLQCNVTGFLDADGAPTTVQDSDGDNVTFEYEWSCNGVVTGNSTMAVLAANTSPGEVWAVRMRLHDGTEYGPWSVPVSVTIANSPPNAPVCAIQEVDPPPF